MNEIGDAGLRDQVNNHYLKIFGASLAIGVIGVVAEARSGAILAQCRTQMLANIDCQNVREPATFVADGRACWTLY